MNGVSAHDVVLDGGMGDVWLWWLEHGLDGIGGGILAVLGVAATLWWDRRSRRNEHKRADLDAVRAVVTEAARTIGRLRLSTGPEDEWTDKLVSWHADLFNAVSDVSSVIMLREPQLYSELWAFQTAVSTVDDDDLGRPDRRQLVQLLNAMEVRLRTWALDPAGYKLLDRLEFPTPTRDEIDQAPKPDEPT